MRSLAWVGVVCLLVVGVAGAQRSRGVDVRKTAGELAVDLAALEKSHLAYRAAAEKALRNQAALARLAEAVAKLAESSGNAKLMAESRKMQEMNMSFNMQYLALQRKMQQESRQFTLLTNVMKTKHETVKNSISNVR